MVWIASVSDLANRNNDISVSKNDSGLFPVKIKVMVNYVTSENGYIGIYKTKQIYLPC